MRVLERSQAKVRHARAHLFRVFMMTRRRFEEERGRFCGEIVAHRRNSGVVEDVVNLALSLWHGGMKPPSSSPTVFCPLSVVRCTTELGEEGQTETGRTTVLIFTLSFANFSSSPTRFLSAS